jgi:membrane glycosyltransferase
MWFALPVLATLVLAVPAAVATTWPPVGAWTARIGLFATPEELGDRVEGSRPLLGRPLRRAA